jgi:hypothetical protein
MLKLERRFPQMPRLRRPAVSALWSLLGDKQASRGRPISVAIDPTQTSSDVGSCAALGGTADMTESSVLSYESTDQVEFRCGFPRSPAPPQPGPKSQQSTASNGHGRRGLTSRGQSCEDGALRLAKRLDKGSRQCCRVHPDQTRRGCEGSNQDVMSGWADTVNSNVAPRGTFALAHNRPPCASMIERQIDRPIPMPADFVV